MKQLITLFLILQSLNTFSNYLVSNENNSNVNNNSSYFETLVLNTDRELYIAGEKIWFNINCFDNDKNSKNILSKIVYIELYNFKKESISKTKHRIINGNTTGFISIPSDLSSGNYYIRTYTQFLRNFSPYFYPEKIISIINPTKLIAQYADTNSENIVVVPQDGKLISGIQTKLAIRINPVLIDKILEISIIDNNNNKIIKISPANNGLALIDFLPEESQLYILRVTLKNGEHILKPLPKVYNSGTILQTEFKNSKLKIRLISNINQTSENNNAYTIELKSHNFKNVFNQTIEINESLDILDHWLPKGIIYILLKNKEGRIIDIQSKYISNNNVKKVVIKKNKDIFKQRELVKLSVNLPIESTNNNYAVSVIKTGTSDSSENLLPTKFTHSPTSLNTYLNNKAIVNEELKEQINIALILFSKIYKTEQFINSFKIENEQKWLSEIRDVGINGKIVNKKTNIAVKDVTVFISVFGESKQFHIYKTKSDGKFFFTLNHLAEKQNIFIDANSPDSSQVKILINNDFSDKYSHTEYIPLYLDSTKHKLIEELFLNYQLNSSFAYHLDKTVESIKYYPLSETPNNITVFLKDFIRIPKMSEIFNEIVPFVSTKQNKNKYIIKVYNNKSEQLYTDPLVLIDGLPIFDMNQVMKISPDLVNKIDVINRKYYVGDFIFNGIIKITTNTKNFAGVTFPQQSVFFEYKTVSPNRSPIFKEYSSDLNKRIPDFRNLLYQNTSIHSKNNTAKIEFYTSDHCSEYDVIFEGINADNEYIQGKTKIKVEK